MSVVSPDLAHDLRGDQRPRILTAPPRVTTAGAEAIDLAALAGLHLDPWQQLVLNESLGETAAGKWASFEVGLIVSRQNGKGSIIEARELAGLFLFGERLILHSAHEFKTTREAFLRLKELIDGTDEFRRRVKRVTNNTFEVGIELTTGQRILFVARSKGSGRGFSGDLVMLDEAFNLAEPAVEALMPAVSARPNPQIWYTSSAPDKDIAPCVPLTRVRNRGLSDRPGSLTYFEWSIDPHTKHCRPDCADHDDPADPRSVAKANPALGYRITLEHAERERDAMSPAGHLRERLGVGNYPSESAARWLVIPESVFLDLLDSTSEADGRVAFAFDVSPGGVSAAIASVGVRVDGLNHVEIIDHRPGTGWLAARMAELTARWNPLNVVADPSGPAGSTIATLNAKLADLDEDIAVREVTTVTARDVGAATGGFIAATGKETDDESTMRIMPNTALTTAVAGADVTPLSDAVKWNRRTPDLDISPVVAVTLARYAFLTAPEDEGSEPWVAFG